MSPAPTRGLPLCAALVMMAAWLSAMPAAAAEAPLWMHAHAADPLPPHDEKTTAVVLYADTMLTVQPDGKLRRLDRQVIKILRPDGANRALVSAYFDAQTRILGMHAWCIPSAGKDYEVKDKEAVETSIGVDGGELVSDVRTRLMRIPAATVGSIVGYEIEQEVRPYSMVDEWEFQDTIPVREAHFTLQLPPRWSYRTTWLGHAADSPTELAPGKWSWSLTQLAPVRIEPYMPPWKGIAGRMLVAVVPPDGQEPGLQSWHDVGVWYGKLTAGRRDVSPEIRRKVAELTEPQSSMLGKMQALARFVQTDIRYVAIELGIGGFQPHSATDVFTHRYGDCKDKATLLSAMLKEIGVDSYYVLINTTRGSVVATTPPDLDFDHAILAIVLPAGVDTASLGARISFHGSDQLLFFDPTDEYEVFGGLYGDLQANFGLIVTNDGGELTQLPQLPLGTNGVQRSASLTLDGKGTLTGDVREVRSGDRAAEERYAFRSVVQDTDRIKPVEAVVAGSLANYEILKAAVIGLPVSQHPFEWKYTLEAKSYGRPAGDLLLVRPRVLGSFARAFLETKEPRQHPVEFAGSERDTDVFEITLPAGYKVDELPDPVKVDEGFATYESKSEVIGHVLRYTRTFEIKELTVPVARADALKQLYRTIEGDERQSAVLSPATH
jgi:transglutaminase-like putative cysteine protease